MNFPGSLSCVLGALDSSWTCRLSPEIPSPATRRSASDTAASDFTIQVRRLCLRDAGLEGPTGSHLKDQLAEQSSGKLGVGPAHLAEGEDEEIQISPQIQPAGFAGDCILEHLRIRAKQVSSSGEAHTPCRSLPGT